MGVELGVVGGQGVPGSARLLAQYAHMDQPQVDVCVLLSPLLRLKHFATVEAFKLAIGRPANHRLHHSIEI